MWLTGNILLQDSLILLSTSGNCHCCYGPGWQASKVRCCLQHISCFPLLSTLSLRTGSHNSTKFKMWLCLLLNYVKDVIQKLIIFQRAVKIDVQCMCDTWKRLLQKILSHRFRNLEYQITQEDPKFKSSKSKIIRYFHLLERTLARIVLELEQNKINKQTKPQNILFLHTKILL